MIRLTRELIYEKKLYNRYDYTSSNNNDNTTRRVRVIIIIFICTNTDIDTYVHTSMIVTLYQIIVCHITNIVSVSAGRLVSIIIQYCDVKLGLTV